MIAFVTAGRGGGGRETYYTVPWCEFIATRQGGQMPGLAWKSIRLLVDVFQRRGIPTSRFREITGEDFAVARELTGKTEETVLMQLTVQLMLELEMFPGEWP